MSQVTFPYERGTYRWTSGYGYRTDPLGRVRGESFHGGVDLAPLNGAPIPTYSPVDGIVTVPSFEANGAGNNIWITDADQVLWKFFHLSAIWVKTGQRVTAGERVAMMGTTGASTGVHGHVERWQGGAYGNRTDPTTYLKEAETVGRYPGAPAPPTPQPEEPLMVTDADAQKIRTIVAEELAKVKDPNPFWIGRDENTGGIYLVKNNVKVHLVNFAQVDAAAKAFSAENRGDQGIALSVLAEV